MTTTQERREFTPQEQREIEKEFYDSQPLKSTCGLCGCVFEGPAAQTREQADAHRHEKHPEVANIRRSKRRTRSLKSFRAAEMTAQDLDDIEKERRRRAFLVGIEIEE